MTPPPPHGPRLLFASALVLVTGCAQGMLSVSPSTVVSTAVLIGDAISRSSSGSRSTGSAGGAGTSIPRSPAATARAARVLDDADQFIGIPYTWGGNTPREGFDCSGFTKYVFAREGIALPRTSRDQAHAGTEVAVDFGAMRPGDLLLFAEPNEAISHVAIYVGDGRIIHSSSALGGVNYLNLGGSRGAWYVQNMVAVRRVAR